jgi:hypothetical protein
MLCCAMTFWPSQVLAKLPLLQQLGVKGCKMTSGDEAQSAALLAQLPLLEILDGQRVRQRIRGRMPPKNTAAESKPTLESKPATSEPPAAGTIVKGKRKGDCQTAFTETASPGRHICDAVKYSLAQYDLSWTRSGHKTALSHRPDGTFAR